SDSVRLAAECPKLPVDRQTLASRFPLVCAGSGARPGSGGLFGLLRHVTRRQRGAVAEEEILHVLGDEILCFLLPRHEPVLIEDHLHALLPELPGIFRDVVENALTELAGPRHRIEAGQLLLEFHAHDLAAALVAGGAGRGRVGGMSAGISHGADCSGVASGTKSDAPGKRAPAKSAPNSR